MTSLLKVITFCIFLTSCATKVTGLQQSDEFTFNNIKQGRLVIGGVASATEDLSSKTSLSYANLMRTHILEEKKGLTVVPAGSVLKKLGKKAYADLLEDYSLTGNIGEKSIALLLQKAKIGRFVAFAKIESNDETTMHDENPAKDSQGNEIAGRTDVTATASRTINVAIQVVDLAKSNVAWSGSISKSMQKSKNYTKKDESGLITLVKAVKGTKDDGADKMFPAPKAPSTKEVLAQVFEGFASNLPDEE